MFIFKVETPEIYPEDELEASRLFGWITGILIDIFPLRNLKLDSAPNPPRPNVTGHNSIKLTWPSVKFYGMYNKTYKQLVKYILEGAEGIEFKTGAAARCSSDIGSVYKVVAVGNKMLSADINDLKNANWYHWRLVVEFQGIRFTSNVRSVATMFGPPPSPQKPLISIKKWKVSGFVGKGHETIKVKFKWNDQSLVEPPVKKFQLQIKEICNKHFNSKLNDMKEVMYTFSKVNSLQLDIKSHLNCGCMDWRTVYCDVVPFYVCEPPRHGCVEWLCRVRSWNQSGWSSFSEVASLNFRAYYDLFPSALVNISEDDQYHPSFYNEKDMTHNAGCISIRISDEDERELNRYILHQ